MKTKLLPLWAVAALALGPLSFTSLADAPPLPGVAENPLEPASKTNQFQGKITEVDKDTKTVTVDDKSIGSHKLQIDDSTKLSKGATAESASFEDLKVGAEIHGTCQKAGSMFRAETVKVSGSDEAK